ncbi:hypothetical protein FJW10_02225 [Mesorhizobium sp. B4-1-1]|nr:hypothetical protein FJW10_02225 [Mesorhizobium sp. B4-1-1]
MRGKASGSLIGAQRSTAMNQFLTILNDVMRIATFQWHGEALRGGCEERRNAPCHHVPPANRYPTRRSRL